MRQKSIEHDKTLILTGESLGIEALAACAKEGCVSIDDRGFARMRAARALIDDAVQSGKRVYGVTTGLGSSVDHALSASELSTFSLQTLRGRAQAVGNPLAPRVVRAAMVVRLNTLLLGAAGASTGVANALRDAINRGVTPVIGESASIGASDLIWGATMGLVLAGEGRASTTDGVTRSAIDALDSTGLKPLRLGPRDGLALASHSSFSAALAALGVADAALAMSNTQTAAALSMLGFTANLSPLRADVLALCERPGERHAAFGLREMLAGSAIDTETGVRRLQDPLSIRNVVQIHGAAFSALDYAREAATADINGASDNPVVLVDTGEVVSGGAYHTTGLAVAIQTLSNALVHLTTAQLARIAKLLSSRFTDLPQYLSAPGGDANGFAPLIKPAEALVAEVIQLANPVPVWPSVCADGVEDVMSNAPLAAKSLLQISEKLQRLNAIELVIASQAVELRGVEQTGPVLGAVIKHIRESAQSLHSDRSMIEEIESLAVRLQCDELRVQRQPTIID